MKKEKSSESKSKWSILLVTGKGKTYAASYVKFILMFLLFGFVVSLMTSFALGVVTFSLMDSNRLLKLENEKLRSITTAVEKENQELKQRVAFFSSFRQRHPEAGKQDNSADKQPSRQSVVSDTGGSVAEKKVKPYTSSNNKTDLKKNASAIVVTLSNNHDKSDEKADEPSKEGGGATDGNFVKVRKFDFDKEASSVVFSFDILNISDIKPLSGYIFVLLRGKDSKPDNWLISPYSEIRNKLPLNIDKGQFFAISRYKPVRIKFPFKDISAYENAEVLVFLRDGKLVLKKGFKINER